MAWVLTGAAAIVVGTLAGFNPALFDALARPPALVRAALVAAMVLAALWLFAEAVRRIEAGRHVAPGSADERDFAVLLRGIRLVFLAVAAASAAMGWLFGSAVPIVVALLIAGVDVLETGFLLLAVSVRGDQVPH